MIRIPKVTMRELDRVKYIQAVIDGDLHARKAAQRLGFTTRQLLRLTQRYRIEGPIGLISKACNRPSNNRLGPELEQRV